MSEDNKSKADAEVFTREQLDAEVSKRIEEVKVEIRKAALEQKAKELQAKYGIKTEEGSNKTVIRDIDSLAEMLLKKGVADATTQTSKKEQTLEEQIRDLQNKHEAMQREKEQEAAKVDKLAKEAIRKEAILTNMPASMVIDKEDFILIASRIKSAVSDSGELIATNEAGEPLTDNLHRQIKFSDAIKALGEKYKAKEQPVGAGGTDMVQRAKTSSKEYFDKEFVEAGGQIGSLAYYQKLDEAKKNKIIA